MRKSTYHRITFKREAEAAWTKLDRLGDAGERRNRFRGLRALIRSGYNDSGAITNLAYFFDTGDGVKPSRRMARHFYRKAYRRGSAVAATNWGIELELEGRTTTAQIWYERAVRADESTAHLRLAKLLLSKGRNLVCAKKLLTKMVAAGPQTVAATEPDGTSHFCEDDEFLEAERLLKELS